MPIQVKLFAEYRDRFGFSEREVDFSDGARPRDVWQWMGGGEVPANLLCARNLDYVPLDSALENGDELAFFPPVSGG